MSGYQEVLTDPSYAGQIVTMTMPHIGNYGVNGADMESRGVFAKGFVVREMCDEPSSWRSEAVAARRSSPSAASSPSRASTPAASTRHLRERGAMRAVISTTDLDAASLVAKAKAVAGSRRPRPGRRGRRRRAVRVGRRRCRRRRAARRHRRAAGRRRATASSRWTRASSTTSCAASPRPAATSRVVPPTTSAEEVLALEPDGVFLANGPGDPSAVDYLYGTLRDLLGVKPVFGICLGHQMLSLAVGAETYKLKYGHRGGNQPVMNLLNGRVEITSQNHGFCVDFGSIGDARRRGERRARRSTRATSVRGCAPGVAPVVTLASASAACSSRTSTSTT